MTHSSIQPPQVVWASGVYANGLLLRQSTRIQNLTGLAKEVQND